MVVRNFNPADAVTLPHVRTGDTLLIANVDQVQCRIGFEGDRKLFAITPAPKIRLDRRPVRLRESLRHWVHNCHDDGIRGELLAAMELVVEENRHLMRRHPR